VVKATHSRECGALEANPTLDRILSRRDLVVHGLLVIGPLAPVGVFGVRDARTGGAVALVYLLATAAMSFTAWSYAEMSRVVPHAGSVFAYASTALGRLPGFLQAILICLFVAGVLFVLQTWLAAVLSPIAPAALLADPSRRGTTFYDITRHAIGGWLAALLSITRAIGPAFAAMTAQAAAARLLYDMAPDGSLPRALASVDARHRVPRVALFSTAALTLAVSVWAASRLDGLELLVSIVDVGALAAFALHVSALVHFVWQRREPPRPGHYLWPVLGAVVTVAVIAAARPLAHVVAGIWLAIGIAVSRLRPTS
jgi:amino acid transporter